MRYLCKNFVHTSIVLHLRYVRFYSGGARQRSWLRHYATSRNVAGSSPDEVDFFFNSPNLANRTMALRWAEPLTEMSTRNLPGG
jgi:hypothetical protein